MDFEPSRTGLAFGIIEAPTIRSTGLTWSIDNGDDLDVTVKFAAGAGATAGGNSLLFAIIDGRQQLFIDRDGAVKTVIPFGCGSSAAGRNRASSIT